MTDHKKSAALYPSGFPQQGLIIESGTRADESRRRAIAAIIHAGPDPAGTVEFINSPLT